MMNRTQLSVRRCASVLLLGVWWMLCSGAVNALEIEHLAYSGNGQPHIDFLKERAEVFEAKTGIKVQINVASSDPAQQILVRAIAGNPPDTMDVYPSAAGELMINGVFEDLTPWFKKDASVRLIDIVPPSLDMWRGVNGEIYAIPPDVVGVATAYNVAYFNEAGVTTPRQMGKGWTWEALLKMIPRLTSDTNGDGRLDRFATRNQFRDLLGAILPMQQAGTHIFDKPVNPSKATFNAPAMLTSLEYMREVWRMQANQDGSDLRNRTTALDLWFQAGYIGYMVEPSVKLEWEVAHQPAGPAGSSTWIGNMGYEIGAGSKNKEAAWKWITFIALDRESITNRVRATGRIPSYVPYLRGFNYAKTFKQDAPASVNVFVEQLQDDRTWQVMPYPVSPAFHSIRQAYNPMALQFLTGIISAEALTTEMQRLAELRLNELVAKK